jgi:hypothetical protein
MVKNEKESKLPKQEEDELVSLNGSLYDEFYIQELESRLETDPLIVGGLADFFTSPAEDSSLSTTGSCGTFSCSEYSSCTLYCGLCSSFCIDFY